jgi:death-on-curing protein
MRFITVGEVIEIADREIGPDKLRSFDLLDSAIQRQINYCLYGEELVDTHTAAAQLLFGICRNHPFVDGNKRVAFFTMAAFLLLNGWELRGESELIALVIDTAEGVVDVATISASLKDLSHLIEIPAE